MLSNVIMIVLLLLMECVRTSAAGNKKWLAIAATLVVYGNNLKSPT